MKRVLVAAAVLGVGLAVATFLGLLQSPAQRAYLHFAHHNDHHEPSLARQYAVGPALEVLHPLGEQKVDKATHKIISERRSPDGRSRYILADAVVCIAGTCTHTRQSATVCRTDDGWKVCGFAESPAP